MSPAIRRRKFPAGAKMRAAVLERVARVFKILDAVVERDDAGDFVADFPSRFAAENMGAFRLDRRRQITQNSPFGPRFANLARNFRTEHDATFGARLGAAIVLLV